MPTFQINTDQWQFDHLLRINSSETVLHSHHCGQLFLVEHGILFMSTNKIHWAVSAGTLCWIPPNLLHSARHQGKLEAYNIYLPISHCYKLSIQPSLFAITPLLKAIIIRILSWTEKHPLIPTQLRLLDVLLDEITQAEPFSLQLPLPQDKRLRKISDHILLHPEDKRSLEEWAQDLHLSRRALVRHFRAQTGLSIGQWRWHARLMHALILLTNGMSVTDCAMELGYDSPSSFIVAFRSKFGITPGMYLLNKKNPKKRIC